MERESNSLRDILITFAGIIYAFSFSLPLEKIAYRIEHSDLNINLAMLMIFLFICCLFFDWLVCTIISIGLQVPIGSLLLVVIAVPFLGFSGYLFSSGDRLEGSVALNPLFIFLLFVFSYDVWGFYGLLISNRLTMPKISVYRQLILHIIISVKIIVVFVLLATVGVLILLKGTEPITVWLRIGFFCYLGFKALCDFISLKMFGRFVLQALNARNVN